MDFLKIRTTKRYNKLYFFGAAVHLEPPSHCAARRPSSGDPPLRQNEAVRAATAGLVGTQRYRGIASAPFSHALECAQWHVFIMFLFDALDLQFMSVSAIHCSDSFLQIILHYMLL